MSVEIAAGDERCRCGNLLARLTPEGVEILCRRCRRKHLIRWAECDEKEKDNVWKEVEKWLAMAED